MSTHDWCVPVWVGGSGTCECVCVQIACPRRDLQIPKDETNKTNNTTAILATRNKKRAAPAEAA